MNKERTEALFAEIAVLADRFEAAISEAKRVQDFNVDTQHLEKMLEESKAVEQRLHAAEKASFSAIKKAGWLSTKSIAICALGGFLIAGFVGGLGGVYLAKTETQARLDEQRQEEIARFSLEYKNASKLINRLRELDVEIYSDALVWNVDSEASDVIRWATIDDPENENERIKIVKITDNN